MVNVVNFKKSRLLHERLFKKLCEGMSTKHSSVKSVCKCS